MDDQTEMTTHIEITMTELVELATLDAFGLLPPADAVKFERAFMAASMDVQSELRRIQDELAAEDSILPDIEPSATLRSRVLAAVAETIEAESDHLAPLATIGITGTTNPWLEEPGAHPADAGRTALPASGHMRPLASVWTWRMAALILLGVAVSLAIFGSDAYRHSKLIANAYTGKITLDDIESRIGPQFNEFVSNPNCHHYYLASDIGSGLLRVAVNENTGEGFVFGLDLDPTIGSGELRLVTADGSIHSLAIINTDQTVVGQSLGIVDLSLFASGTFAHLEFVDGNKIVLIRST
jgi:hypothetical protein